ncbi:MAG: hypothetical protein GYA46_13985 [candidate division Zixibacteria bacterium]|nr:hypothetical protein [candidate division Zixibacteria bacterium]
MTKQDLLQRISKSLGLVSICIIIIVGEVFATEGNPIFRCTSDIVSADTIVARIKANHDIYVDSCVITGDVIVKHDSIIIYGNNPIRSVIRFKNTKFTGNVDISNRVFQKPMYSINNIFEKSCGFSADRFESIVNMEGSIFNSWVVIAVSEFREDTYFNRVRFMGPADFSNTLFLGKCRFDSAAFQGKDLVEYEGDLSVRMIGYGGAFEGTRLLRTNFQDAELGGVIFQPDTMSVYTMKSLSRARGLRRLMYADAPEQLQSLKTYFRENNFRGQERQITCALKRHEQNLFERIIFDLPFEYGSNIRRPFAIVGYMLILSWLCFISMVFLFKDSGIYKIVYSRKGAELIEDRAVSDLRHYHDSVSHLKLPSIGRVKGEYRLLKEVGKFAILNVFNVGFRDFSFGNWVRLLFLHKTEYEPYGRIRFVAGIQAITSVLLMALGIIFYYGRFFE